MNRLIASVRVSADYLKAALVLIIAFVMAALLGGCREDADKVPVLVYGIGLIAALFIALAVYATRWADLKYGNPRDEAVRLDMAADGEGAWK